ncbi:MAG: trypsin-like peptidase domain-containing protein [Pirellulales bacterium]|nr:trypsin-like peptidase domain-containing protein [Pirellulales bacterium]
MPAAAWLVLAGLLTSTVHAQVDELQVLQSFEQVLVGVIGKCEDSVVAIARVRKDDVDAGVDPTSHDFVPNEYATGVVVDSAGLVLTNFHLMREDSDYWVTTSQRRIYKVTDWWGDERLDLAVLKTEATNLSPMKFGDAENLRKGKIVIALGNPYAIARDGQVCASWGIISNLKRKPATEARIKRELLAPPAQGQSGPRRISRPEKISVHQYGTLIYSDVRLERGTSGGALLDLKGRLIGLTTSLAGHVGYEKSAGYAIAMDGQMQEHVESLKKGQEIELGFLGIHVEDRPELMRQGVPGVRITGTVFGTSADQAGLQSGDVISAIDGLNVYNSDELFLQFRKRLVDDRLRLLIERDGGRQDVVVKLDKAPPAGRQKFIPSPTWRGLRVDHSSVLIQSGFGRGPESSRGVAIIFVERESSAWQAGLRAGMIITAVDGEPVSHPRICRRQCERASGEVALTVDAPAGDEDGLVVIMP